MNIVEKIEKMLNEKAGDGPEYKAFFKKMLKKYGVSGVKELSPDEKKKFFDEIENKWTTEEK